MIVSMRSMLLTCVFLSLSNASASAGADAGSATKGSKSAAAAPAAAVPRSGTAAQFATSVEQSDLGGSAAASADLGYFTGNGRVYQLLEWVRAHGGVAHLKVGEVCPGCMRGTLATKDFERGDLVASVPPELVVDIGPRSLDLAVRSGYDVGNLFLGCPSEKLCSCALRQADAAANWIKLMHTDRDYNASFKPFLDTLPHIGEVLSPEMWTPEMIAESQSDDLAIIVSSRVEEAEAAWREAGFDDGRPDEDGTSIKVSLAAFKHAVACIATRMYGYPSPLHDGEQHMQLLPVFDMANCADAGLAGPDDAGSNAEVQYPDGDGTFTMLAKRRIRKGEEVTNNYGHNYLHRPDMSLLVYGFVPVREPPVMSTVDLPAGFGSVTHPQTGYPPTPVLEPDYGNATGVFSTEAELQRLAGIYAGLPTTLEQDLALMGQEADPHMRMLLQWRIARKRALLAAISQLSASLALRHKVWPRNQNYEPPAPGGVHVRQVVANGAAAAATQSEPLEGVSAEPAQAAATAEAAEQQPDPPADSADRASAADGGIGPSGGDGHEEL